MTNTQAKLRHVGLYAGLLFTLLAVPPASAADGTAINVIGFSRDGRYFAFEQYGENSGSGALTSEITVIDTTTDRFVAGTPLREVFEPETDDRSRKPVQLKLADVRAASAARAKPLLTKLAIDDKGLPAGEVPASKPHELLGQIHIGPVRDADLNEMAPPPSILGGGRLVLREADIDVARCKDLVREGKPKGFTLALDRKDKPAATLFTDRAIPMSRGCPARYGIAGAYAIRGKDGAMVLAVLIQYFYMSFEGDDRRFLAVTARVK